ncbi:MAG: hypothetical protein ACYCZF_06250 [Anaerolineae bacterium]
MKTVNVLRVLAVLMLVGVLLGCATTPVPPRVYAVGEAAEAAGIKIVLNSYKMAEDNVFIMNFTVTNNSEREFNVSTRFSMEGRDASGTKLIFTMCPENELGGRISVGQSVTGDVCLAGTKTLEGVQVVYDPTHQLEYTISWEPR